MKRARKLSLSLLLTALVLLAGLGGASGGPRGRRGPAPSDARSPGSDAPAGRVVILGFDGADARTARELMEKDPARYPNFRRLAEEGSFAPLEVVVPAESPVSWASLNSGQNPAKTGVPGFIRRQLEGPAPLPNFGHIRKGSAALETFQNTPLPIWNQKTTALVWGGASFLIVLMLALLLLRRLWLAALLGLVAGGGGAWAGHRARGLLPANYPRTFNVNQVRSFWDYAAESGVACVVLDAAEAFDAPETPGARVLHGLGLPDSRGDLGQWFVYTTDPKEFERRGRPTTTAGAVFRVDEDSGLIRSQLYGPKNFWLEQELQAQLAELDEQGDVSARRQDVKQRLDTFKDLKDLTAGRTTVELEIRREGEQARVRIGDTEQTLAVGEWSEFYEVDFELNWLLSVHAITRVRLVQLEPHLELFVNVLDIDPRKPPFWQPISTPFGFAGELARECGLYETYGWPTLTMPFKDKIIPPEILLEDVEFTERWRERLTHELLGRDDWRCLVSVFSTPDRVQHMTYQFHDTEHPLHDPESARRETSFFGETIPLSDAVPAIYRQIDRIIGEVWGKLRPEDTLLVCSDHGFQTFRRQVHLNNWLAENGYLTVKPGLSKANAQYLSFVDWSRTRVYACGLGFLYLNLEGREPQGTVARDDARGLMDEVKQKLLEATDPDTGTPFCRDVYVPRDIHQGDHLSLEADLIPGFAAPYRVGWSTSSGGIELGEDGKPAPSCTDNDSNWSGDHVSMSLQDVPGIFGCNRKVRVPGEGVRALQIAPTVLELLGVAVPAEMDLPALEFE